MNAKQINILFNYVLIKPDQHLETYQMRGKEIGLISPDFKYENGEKISVKERNFSTIGTVYAVPQNLVFNLDKILHLKEHNTLHVVEGDDLRVVNIGVHRQIDQLINSSVKYNCPMEVNIGDRVNFSYMVHKQAKESKMIVDTDEGEMYLVKYDMLYMTVSEDNKPLKMLNGWLIVEPEEIEVLKENGKEFIEHESGLVTLTPKNKIKKFKKNQIGKVINYGTKCERYLTEPNKHDFWIDSQLQGKVLYNSGLAQKMEYDTHQIMSDKVLHLLQRKDIHMVVDNDYSFEKDGLPKLENIL